MNNPRKPRLMRCQPLLPRLEGQANDDASRGLCCICRSRNGVRLRTIEDYACLTCQVNHVMPAVRACL